MTDFSQGGASGGLGAAQDGRTFVLTRTIDFAETPATASGSPHPVFYIPAKTFVQLVQADVETAEGGTLTFDLGDGSAAAGFLSNVNGNSVGSSCSALALTEGTPNTVTGYSAGKYYSALTALNLTLDNDADAAKVTIRALCIDLASK